MTREQLLRAGVTARQIEHRMRTGALLREHPGVYRVGHRAPSVDCRWPARNLTVELDSYRFHTHATRGSRTDA